MAQAHYIMPFADFDYEGWAEQLGLSVMKSAKRADGNLDFIVEGLPRAIAQFSSELDFPPARIIYKPGPDGKPEAGSPGPDLLRALINNFGSR